MLSVRSAPVLVDVDNYLLELVRYIHLNPVRAGMVKNPSDYEWGGHRSYLGEETLTWLTTNWVLNRFSRQVSSAQQRYAIFIQEGAKEGYREEFHRGGVEH